jgi:hypothetical protein
LLHRSCLAQPATTTTASQMGLLTWYNSGILFVNTVLTRVCTHRLLPIVSRGFLPSPRSSRPTIEPYLEVAQEKGQSTRCNQALGTRLPSGWNGYSVEGNCAMVSPAAPSAAPCAAEESRSRLQQPNEALVPESLRARADRKFVTKSLGFWTDDGRQKRNSDRRYPPVSPCEFRGLASCRLRG